MTTPEEAALVAEAESYTDYRHLSFSETMLARLHDPARDGPVPSGWSIIQGFVTAPKHEGPFSISYRIMPTYELAVLLQRKRRRKNGGGGVQLHEVSK